MPDRSELLADLAAESDALDAVVAGLDETDWARPSPAEGWTIAHQIGHLAWTDDWALTSARNPAAFLESVAKAGEGLAAAVDNGANAGATHSPDHLLARWQAGPAPHRGAAQRT